MAEALADDASLRARLERQSRFAHAQRLAIRGLGFGHSGSNSSQFGARLCPLSPGSAVRKRSRRAKRARKVSLEGPVSRAACTTFDRPNAKSNWAEVNS